MAYTPGPKELELKALREARQTKKPSAAHLRQQIAKVKPSKIRKGGGRGR